jgi:HSP20 family protein
MFKRMLFDDFRRSFERLFEDFGSSLAMGNEAPFAWTFAPVVETGWTENHFNLRLIVPGVTEKDLKVTVQGNQLHVQGERKEPKELSKSVYSSRELTEAKCALSEASKMLSKSVYSSRELTYGKFESMINLPGGLELEKIEAHLHDGVLDIRIPVAAAMKPREIPISAGGLKALGA